MEGCDWVSYYMRSCDQKIFQSLSLWWVPGACRCRDEGEERGGVFRYRQFRRVRDGDGDGGGGGEGGGWNVIMLVKYDWVFITILSSVGMI